MNEFLGLYPAWLEPGIGAGWVIGFIATCCFRTLRSVPRLSLRGLHDVR